MYKSEKDQKSDFINTHRLHVPVGNNKHLVTLSGIVVINFTGTAGAWKKDKLSLSLLFPTGFLKPDKHFLVENWTPFFTISSIYNGQTATNAGWAIDKFGCSSGGKLIREEIDIWAEIAASDNDGTIHRVGYTLTVCGEIRP